VANAGSLVIGIPHERAVASRSDGTAGLIHKALGMGVFAAVEVGTGAIVFTGRSVVGAQAARIEIRIMVIKFFFI
jgi:hypothetical protein